MKVKELIKLLKSVDENEEVKVASDEEWNNIYKETYVEQDSDNGNVIIFGVGYEE